VGNVRKQTFFWVVLVLIFIAVGQSLLAAPQRGDSGLGIILGAPTAITGKYWKDDVHAVDMGLGYWFGNFIELYGDYLWHFPGSFKTRKRSYPEFFPYLGVGADLHMGPGFGLYGRIPLGIEWLPQTAPFGVFAEIVPGIQLAPGLGVVVGGGIGVRYYF